MNNQITQNKDWDLFKFFYIIFFTSKFFGYIIIGASQYNSTEPTTTWIITGMGLQFIGIIGMTLIFGHYAYKFTKKWYYGFYCFFGVFWVGFILPITGYFFMRNLKHPLPEKSSEN